MQRKTGLLWVGAFLVFGGCRGTNERCHPRSVGTAILTHSKGWDLVQDSSTKLSFEFSGSALSKRPSIYVEMADVSDEKKPQFLDALIETYRQLYGDVNYQHVGDNAKGFDVIDHTIRSEGKRLRTTVIPQRHGYLLVVLSDEKADFDLKKVDYDGLVDALLSEDCAEKQK